MKPRIQPMRPLIFAILATAIAFISDVACPSAATAATYYVATTGNDANVGSQSQPFRTIKKGVSVLKAGDTLYIRGGTYAESIDSNTSILPAGTSWTNPVTIAASPGETVILKPWGGDSVLSLAASYVRYLIFDGLVIDATNMSYGVSGWGGANHIRIQNGQIKNAKASGAILASGNGLSSDYFEFINMKVHHNGSSRLDHGIYIATSNNLVERCEIYSNTGYGVHVFISASTGEKANRNIIRQSIIRDNSTSGDATSAGIILSSGYGNLAYNNIILNNPYGIQIGYDASSTKVYNNTIYANKYFGIDISSSSTSTTVRNNILYQNGGTISNTGSDTVQSNNMTGNPLFVDAAAANFSLQPGSPAIDTGVPVNEVTNDFSGISRPQGVTYDIGAYEYRSTLPAPANFRSVSQ